MLLIKHLGGLSLLMVATLIALSTCSDAVPVKETPKIKPGQYSSAPFDITSDDLSDENNNILLYEPLEPRPIEYKTTDSRDSQTSTKLKPNSFTVQNTKAAESQADDAELSGSANVEKIKDIALNSREVRLVGPNQREVEMKDDLPTKVVVALENLQKEAKEVYGQVNEKLDKGWTELKNSEVWTQINDKLDKGWTEVKKAEVWGQINEKLDKGWTDLKSMVEGAIDPNTKSG